MCSVGPLLTTLNESGLMRDIWICFFFGIPHTYFLGLITLCVCIFVLVRSTKIEIGKDKSDVSIPANRWFKIIALLSTILAWITMFAVWAGSQIPIQLISVLYSGTSSLYASTPAGNSYLLNSLYDMAWIVAFSVIALMLVGFAPYTLKLAYKIHDLKEYWRRQEPIIPPQVPMPDPERPIKANSKWKLIITRAESEVRWQKGNESSRIWNLEAEVTFDSQFLAIEEYGPVLRDQSAKQDRIVKEGYCVWPLEFNRELQCFCIHGVIEKVNLALPDSPNRITPSIASDAELVNVRCKDRIKINGNHIELRNLQWGETI